MSFLSFSVLKTITSLSVPVMKLLVAVGAISFIISKSIASFLYASMSSIFSIIRPISSLLVVFMNFFFVLYLFGIAVFCFFFVIVLLFDPRFRSTFEKSSTFLTFPRFLLCLIWFCLIFSFCFKIVIFVLFLQYVQQLCPLWNFVLSCFTSVLRKGSGLSGLRQTNIIKIKNDCVSHTSSSQGSFISVSALWG